MADAGPDQTAVRGQSVALDGSGSSDPDGDELAFSWQLTSVPEQSAAVLDDPSAVDPGFVVDALGRYVAELVVNDGVLDSAPDSVYIDTLNSPPVAAAGPDQSAYVGDRVTLDGSGSGSSDVDGQALSVQWELMPPSGSGAVLDDRAAVMPSFSIDVPGDYLGVLRVNDGLVSSDPDSVTVSTLNSVPVADAGPDQTVFVGEPVILDGSSSNDADGNPLTFFWSLTSPFGSLAALDDAEAVMPGFTPDLPGTYLGQLIVNDGTIDSAPDTVSVTTENTRPVACITAIELADVGVAMSLDGLCSEDADGDPLVFQWSLASTPEGSAADLYDTESAIATLVPDFEGLYVIQLIVSDGALDSDPVTAAVTAEQPPPPNRAPEITSTAPTAATVGVLYS